MTHHADCARSRWSHITWTVLVLVPVLTAGGQASPTGSDNPAGGTEISDARLPDRQLFYPSLRLRPRARSLHRTQIAALPDDAPEDVAIEVERNGSPHVLHLRQGSVRGPNFQVLVQVSDGSLVEIEPGPVGTYIGYVEDEPGTIVSASLSFAGWRAVAFPESGPGWSIEPLRTVDPSASRNEHVVYSHDDLEPVASLDTDAVSDGEIAVLDAMGRQAPSDDIAIAAGPTYAAYGCDVMRAELAIDADYSVYEYSGESVDATMENLEDLVNYLNVIYLRDCLIEYKLGKVVIRTDAATCPYHSLSEGFLDTFVNQWKTGRYGTTYSLAMLATMRTGGGLAYVGTVCKDARYSFSGGGGSLSFLKEVARHELGHNWNCPDLGFGCAEGPTIMCGNTLSRFSADEVAAIVAYRNSVQCLTRIGPYSSPIPPYAATDRVSVSTTAPVLVDVLANDHDANCDTLVIDAFDPISQLGGTVSRSTGSGPGHRDQLLYTPSGRFGLDSFGYTIRDATGLKSSRTVNAVMKSPRRMLGYWPFDETSGTIAQDFASNGFDGALKGSFKFDAASVQGHFGRGLSFNGTNSYVDMSKTAGQLGEITGNAPRTVSVWVYTRKFNHGGIYEMGQDSTAGQDFSLRTMDVDNKWRVQYWAMDIDFTVTSKNKWVHFAHVHDGVTTRVYADGNLVASKACVLTTGDTKNFQVGKWTTYYFDGIIDDLRVYDYAMDATAIRAVMAGGQAECVSPADTEGNVPQRVVLTWTPSAKAQAHDVYLGTSLSSVSGATAASPQYQGRQEQNSFVPFLDFDTKYFWRIDEVAGETVIAKGKVWSFTTGDYAGVLTREVWTDVAGAAVSDLTGSWTYPSWPDERGEITSFEEPVDWAENFGSRVHGYLVPRQTDNYTFWIASDDQSELWLSNDADPANKVRIAQVSSWTTSRQWDKSSEQRSEPIFLTAGNAYYIAALHKEQLYGDNLSVAWEGSGISRQVISGLYLSPYDKDRPTPNPMSWAEPPHATSSTSISMTATTAMDRSGVEYYFACVDGPGNSSNWQSSPHYEDKSLLPGESYSYTVRARDKSHNQNRTEPSEPHSVQTPGQ